MKAKKAKKSKKKIPALFIMELVAVMAVVACFGYYWISHHRAENNAVPVITVEEGTNEFSVTATEDDLLVGVTAMDPEDGNVTESVIIESISQLIDGNKRTITYVAFDSSNNVAKYDRDIIYTDYTPPTFTNKKTIMVEHGTASEILDQLTAVDVIDGDISDQIRLEVNEVRTNIKGTYPIRAGVTNSCGDVTTKDVIVIVTGEEE